MLAPSREFTFTDQDFSFLSELVGEHTGIMLPPQKRNMVYGRLAKRLRQLNLNSFQDYCELLQSEAGQMEMGNLVNAVTTNLTGFFREAHHFEHLSKEVLPKYRNENRLRLWSAGCSTGAEPYSMAMCLRDVIPDAERKDMKILASDIDTHVLDAAERGEYTSELAAKTPEAFRQKYFTELGNGKVEVDDRLKQLVAFRHLNLLGPWPMSGKFDVIFCRNVVIYFDKATQSVLFDRFADMLKPNGWLYIGHSETLHTICDRFSLIGKTVYKKVR